MATDQAIIGDVEASAAAGRSFSFHLPGLAWLFVTMAVVEAVMVLQGLHLDVRFVPAFVASGDSNAPAALLSLVGSLTTILLPAGILYRAPNAARMHPVLLVGATLLSVHVLGLEVLSWLVRQPQTTDQLEALSSLAPFGMVMLLVGLALVGIGLTRIRRQPMSRRAALATLVAVALGMLATGLTYAGIGIPDGDAGIVVLDLATALAAGYLLAVPIAAWLDGERPAHFWIPLAVAAVAGLTVDVLQAIGLVMRDPAASSFLDAYGTATWVASVTAVVVLVTVARALPAGERVA